MKAQGCIILGLMILSALSEDITFAGIPDNDDLQVAWKNGGLLNQTLAAMKPGDELFFPENTTYHLVGGITAYNLSDNVIHFDGTLRFTANVKTWPTKSDGSGQVLECFQFFNINNVTFTSSTIGLLNGHGETWWGLLGYVEYLENRPRMLSIANSKNLLIENLYFQSSPYWTVWITDVDGLEIRNSEISNRRNDYDGHDWWNLAAWNTDGFDVTGKNVWIHDCRIWNQDDCIAVKDGSENMLFERIHASGLGLVIGSIGESTVRNITFRDCWMHKTYKGIYLKFRGSGLIEDVTYENIVMDQPEQWPIWIGPAQQADSVNICHADPCSICWPDVPFAQCNMPSNAQYRGITLRNITVNNPVTSTGIIFGSADAMIQDITFENVQYTNPIGDWYLCQNVASGKSIDSYPSPKCLQ
eukprot:TRINITY_DN842_c1_g1_i1.p1 TRINITY_DN842_c1_g1~~TRINITY_DN842_c1_g1_i1.p1  ORF type:complete len:427 (-),score=92.12 TRINITY_DN842_c1_g1_i1:50-1294(-)